MLATFAAVAFAASSGAPAGAQMAASTPGHAYPSIGGAKVRGMEGLNNSGQVGTVTLTQQPKDVTHVILTVKGTGGKTQTAAIYRNDNPSCKNIDEKPDFTLSPVVSGTSSTMIPIDRERLLSGNYMIVVKSGKTDVACSHLHTQ